ncbi:18250_t:CDS:1, partial [Gigaspora rosea]
ETLTNKLNEVLKDPLDKINNLETTKPEDLEKKLKQQINEALKDPLDKINKLIDIIEKKE